VASGAQSGKGSHLSHSMGVGAIPSGGGAERVREAALAYTPNPKTQPSNPKP